MPRPEQRPRLLVRRAVAYEMSAPERPESGTGDEGDLELPELIEGVLDAEGVLAYGRQLDRHVDARDVTTKGGATTHASSGRPPLWDAVNALLAGEVRAVQIRYRFDDTPWIDTLMRTPDETFRLVRIVNPVA